MFATVTRPIYYNSEFGGEECPGASPMTIAKVLASNPSVNLKIIVRARTFKTREKKTRTWLYELVTREKIPRERIHVRFSRKLDSEYPVENVEFWFVPKAERKVF
jgi:hypothetical protein